MRLVVISLVLLLQGCASFSASQSFVARHLSTVEAAQVGTGIGEYLHSALPAAQTVIVIERPRFAAIRDDVGPVLVQTLRVGGFAVMDADASRPIPGARRLSYVISSWQDGVSVRVQLDGYVISRWYVRTAGGLVATSPFTVREALSHGG